MKPERLKVMPELMLAADWSGMSEVEIISRLKALGRTQVRVTRKFDGVRVIRKDAKLLSKYGNEFPDNAASRWLKNITSNGWEGEFIVEGGTAGDAVSALKTGRGDINLWNFYLFDILNRKGVFKIRERDYFGHLSILSDIENAIESAFRLWGQGGDIEGFMIDGTDRYLPGRMPPNGRDGQIFAKWKPLKTIDVPVLYVCTGKKGLGSIVCRCPNTGMAFEVGTGFTDADRKELMNAKGLVVEIAYRGFLKDGRPKFPSFKQIKQGV